MSRVINLQEETPLRELKNKTVYAPKGAFRVEGELRQGGQGAINGHDGYGFEVDHKERLTLLDPSELSKHRTKAKIEANRKNIEAMQAEDKKKAAAAKPQKPAAKPSPKPAAAQGNKPPADK